MLFTDASLWSYSVYLYGTQRHQVTMLHSLYSNKWVIIHVAGQLTGFSTAPEPILKA